MTKETFTQRIIRETREAEASGLPLTAFDFDQACRVGLATVAADRCPDGSYSPAGELAFDNAIDDATHMTDSARERVDE
jgi:hypothetical protein